jgi:dihydroorotase
MTANLLLKNAHVIDPAQGLDGVMDVAVVDGLVAGIGQDLSAPAGADVLDLTGRYLSPGWIDIHVHAYGSLGFGDADSIGIYQGVTSFVDAGGTGVGTLDECMALCEGMATRLYAGPLIYPMGIVGLDYVETGEDVLTIEATGLQPWRDWIARHPGLLRYVKAAAYSPQGAVPIGLARDRARQLGLPLYLHIGENYDYPDLQSPFEEAFRLLERGDIVTHCYHGANDSVLDKQGLLRPAVKAAMARGVLFDVGFGAYGFSWEVAQKALAQGLRPTFISSDLQQFNVLNPVHSLANVMSICHALGLPLAEVIAGVTSGPATHLDLAGRAGALRPGMPADITVFSLEAREAELNDGFLRKRKVGTHFAPLMAFRDGLRFDCDLLRAQDERNWFMQVCEDAVPSAAASLSHAQLEFLGALATALEPLDWTMSVGRTLSLSQATLLQETFHAVRREQELPLLPALNAVYDAFLEHRLPMQVGLLLVRIERSLVLARLREVAAGAAIAA